MILQINSESIKGVKQHEKSTKIILSIFIIAVCLNFSYQKIIMSQVESNLNALLNAEIKEINLNSIEDGKYFGSYEVVPIAVEVFVTVSDHQISKIEIVNMKTDKALLLKQL